MSWFKSQFPGPGPARRSDHRTVLIADGDPGVQIAVASFLGRRGFFTVVAGEGTAALRCLRLTRALPRELGSVDVVLADVDLPGRSGIDILMITRDARIDVPVLLTASSVSTGMRAELIRLGAAGVLTKPLSLHQLGKAISLLVADQAPLRNIACLSRDPQGGGA
jgi:DNA-binding response OmpR family regulator